MRVSGYIAVCMSTESNIEPWPFHEKADPVNDEFFSWAFGPWIGGYHYPASIRTGGRASFTGSVSAGFLCVSRCCHLPSGLSRGIV